jgi:hypothetical protein
LFFQLAVSMPTTDETECSSSPPLWATPIAANSKGTSRPPSKGGGSRDLRQDVRLWPTPLAQEAKHAELTEWEMKTDHLATKYSLRVQAAKSMWPTPTSRDHKGGYQGGRIRNGKVSMDTLDVAVQYTSNPEKTGGSLNPQWVEWLMGYPSGWTDLEA